MIFVKRVELRERAVHKDGAIVSGFAQEADEALRLAERVGADEMRALGKLCDRLEQLRDFACVVGMPKHRQAERRFGNEHVARDRLEGRAGRIAAAFVIAGNDRGDAFPAHDDLCGAQDVPCGHERDDHTVVHRRFAISHGLHRVREAFAIARFHDVERFARRQHCAVPGAGMIAVAVGDHRARHRPHRIDDEIAGNAAKPGRRGTEKIGRFHFG